MPFVPVPNTCQVEMVFDFHAQTCENVYHVVKDTDWSEADLGAIAETFTSWWQTNMRALHHLGLTLTRVKARNIETSTGLGVEVGVSSNNVGTATGSPYPNNAAVSVKWTTALSGRSYRGRTYHMGLSDAFTQTANQNLLTSTFAANLRTGYLALMTAVNVAAKNLVVVSKYTNNAPRTTGLATVILGVSVNTALDSQRRRLPERGQ